MNRIASLFVLIGLSGCGQGTNTGNPGLNSPTGANSTIALTLVAEICERVSACFSRASVTSCHQQVTKVTGYTSKLGHAAASFDTIEELAKGELNLKIEINGSRADTCLRAIHTVSCDDPVVVGSYSPNNPTSYESTNLFFDASPTCQEIYE